jgi:hypothetical protein
MKAELLPESDDDPDVLHDGIDWGKIAHVLKKPAASVEKRFHVLMKWAPNQKFVQAAVLKLRRKRQEERLLGIEPGSSVTPRPEFMVPPVSLPLDIAELREQFAITRMSEPPAPPQGAYSILADLIKVRKLSHN